MPSWRTSTSNPKFFLLCGRLRLKVTMWWVPNQRSFKTVSVPSGKLTGWLARLWLSLRSRKNPRPARKWRHPRRRLLDLQSLTGWAPLHPRHRGLSRRSRPFDLEPEGPVQDPSRNKRSLARLLRLPQPDNVDGSQVGARLANFALHWRSLLGNCRATGIVEDGMGIAFQQRPQLTHQSISFRTRNSRQDLQQAVDALLMKGAIERVTNVKALGFYSRLFLVPKKTGDLRPVIDLSTLNRHMVVPHFKMETQGSVRSAIRSQEWMVSIDIRDAYLHVPMHQAVRKYLAAFRGQQEGVPVHLSSIWTGDFSLGVHQAAATCRLAVKAARCEATRLLRRLADQGRYSGTGSTAGPDNHQGAPVSWLDHQLREVRSHTKSRLPVHRDAVQHSTFHSGAPAENAFKGPVSSSALDGQSEHNSQRSAQTSRHAGVHGFAGPARMAPSSSSPMVGRHSMVPEDRELVRPDSSSTVGSVRGDMVVIPSSPARSTPHHQGDGSTHRCVQFGLGSPVRLTLDTGTVVSISTIVPHKRSGDAGCHLCCERLPTSSEVPSGAIDVRQRSDGGVHQERGGHEIAHFDADDHTAAQVVWQQGDYVGSRPSARSAQHPGVFPVQSRPDTDHGVDDGHGESTTRVCQVGQGFSQPPAISAGFYKLPSVFAGLYTTHMPKYIKATFGDRRNNKIQRLFAIISADFRRRESRLCLSPLLFLAR